MEAINQQKRWLVDYELDTFLSIVEEEEPLEYRHPGDIYQVTIRNLSTEPGTETPLLSAQITFFAEDIETAEELGDKYLREFLYYLTFTTNSKYRIHRRKRLIDWSPGLAEREQYLYKTSPPDQPHPYLSGGNLETVSMLQSWESPEAIRRALRWFSAAVGAELMEDQFQYFWFVIELLAVAARDPAKIPDKCPVCKGDLYCRNCDLVPTHKPYPKQSIRELVRKNVSNEPDKLFEKFDEVRNMLMHGADRSAIESRLEIDKNWKIPFDKIVDLLGGVAWTAILNSFTAPPGKYRPSFIQISTYVNRTMTFKVHAIMGSPGDKDNPKIEDQPTMQMEVSLQDSNSSSEPSDENLPE